MRNTRALASEDSRSVSVYVYRLLRGRPSAYEKRLHRMFGKFRFDCKTQGARLLDGLQRKKGCLDRVHQSEPYLFILLKLQNSSVLPENCKIGIHILNSVRLYQIRQGRVWIETPRLCSLHISNITSVQLRLFKTTLLDEDLINFAKRSRFTRENPSLTDDTTHMRPSALPETTPVPSALKAAAVTGSECEAIVRRHLPVATSQIFTFSSNEPLTYRKRPQSGFEIETLHSTKNERVASLHSVHDYIRDELWWNPNQRHGTVTSRPLRQRSSTRNSA